MREEIKVGDMIEVTEVRDGYGYFKKGDKAKVVKINPHFCDFNQPGQEVTDDGFWYVGEREGGSKCRKIETKKGIKIKVEKFVDNNGNRMVKILDIEALPWDKLPQEYKNGECVYLCPKGNFILNRVELSGRCTYHLFGAGSVMVNTDFSASMEIIKRCGERLAEINKKNRTKKKEKQVPPQKKREWSGEKEYVI